MEAGDQAEIDMGDSLRTLWRYKYVIVAAVFLCGVTAVVLALTTKPVFRAETVVTEVKDQQMSGAASLASQFGSLASIAGMNLKAGGSDPETLAVLKSRKVVEEFITRHNVSLELFPKPSKKPPTLWRAVLKFQQGVLSIRDDTRKGTTTVAIEWTDPAVAAQWANQFVALVNEILRRRAIDASERNIAYLNDQIARTHVVELQRVMYNLVETEAKTLMLANARAEYAFAVVDPAVPPEIRIRPKRTIMVIFGLAIGFFIGVGASFAHNAMTRRRVALKGP